MPFASTIRERTNTDAQAVTASEPPFYPNDLLPELQHLLAVLADLDIRHEIA